MKNVEDVYAASPLQQGLIFHGLYAPESSAYTVQMVCDLEGRLDAGAFREAWRRVFARYSVLRTCFVWEDIGEVLQVVRLEVELPWREWDWRAMSAAEQGEELETLVRRDRAQGFEFSKAPLVRIALVRLGEGRAKFVWSHHHSLLDGWSAFRVFGDAFKLYEGIIGGREVRLSATRPYRDYIGWLQRQDLAAAERFWRERLRGFTHPSPLTREQRVRAVPEAEAGSPEPQSNSEYISLTAETTEALKSLARQHRLTLNTIMQGAWALLLSRYSGEPDVVFGAVVSGRPPELEGVEEMVGLFINLLPVRVRVEEGAELVGWLKGLQAGQVEARCYEYSPLVDVQGWSDVPRGQPLFETMMVFENYPISAAEQGREGSLKITKVRSIEKTNYPLTFAVVPASGLVLQLSYDPALFTPSRVSLMLRHLAHLLDAFASSHPDSRLRDLHLLSPDERRLILSASNDPDDQNDPAAPPAAPLHRLFERQARLTPDRAAVIDRGRLLTYRQLDARADALARLLHERGAGPESLVGLMLGRRAELVVATLAILKAGCAYVPLDPKYPAERIAFMLGDADVALLVTERRWLGLAGGYAERAVCLDADPEAVEAMSAEASGDVAASGDVEMPGGGPTDRMESLAYVIYTSGSTGRPKGVAITHRSASALLRWASALYSDHELAGVLFSTSVCFDLSVFELFAPLTRGGAVILADDALELPTLPEAGLVTLVNTVPSAMAELVRSGPLPDSVRVVNLAGEPLADALAQRVYGAGAGVGRVLNLYGPTEDTTYTTYSEVARGGAVNIGRAVTGTRVYLLDGRMEAVPAGVKAELYIGGEGLARGYLGRAGLTAERFVPDPHGGVGGGRLYRTGDLARHLPDGQIEYLGRADHQVKVRGFRIELGEIETALLGHEALRDAVVIVRDDAVRGKELVAYVVADSEPAPGASELRQRLSEKLPDYMIPQTFVYLERLPLTANGKVDRRVLPDPGETRGDGGGLYVAARTATEQAIVDVWQEVLGVERVGVHDNFFDLGGHSLLATQVVSRLRVACGVAVAMRRLFEKPTVAQLAKEVDDAASSERPVGEEPMGRVPKGEPLPLSFAQQRLWFLDQLQPGSAAYNMALALRLTGVLNVGALEHALREVSRRHEALRTTFVTVDEAPVQFIGESGAVAFIVEDLTVLAQDGREAEAARRASEEAKQPFDLSRGPLLRVKLLRLGADEHALLVTLHHIISDGWSLNIFMREVATLYEAFAANRPSPLQDLPAQYADYASWQRRWLRGEALDKQLSYWRGQLAGVPPALELPTDRKRLAGHTSDGATHLFAVPQALKESLQKLSRANEVTLFMTLLAAFQALLRQYSGQDDVVVGSPIAGRNHGETEALIGCFVNTLVLRTDFSSRPSFEEVLRRVREVCLGAYAHQDVPFEKLVEELQPERDLSRTPLFQVMFNLHNAPQRATELPGLRLSSIGIDAMPVKFDLSLTMAEETDRLLGALTYNTALFDAQTIESMAGHFVALLEAVVTEPRREISRLPLLTGRERQQLLVGWNQTASAYPVDDCLHELFEAQAERTPHATAVVYEGERLTYRELNERANQLARYLIKLGVGPERPVGILMERSAELVVGLLAVLKAGGAYLPLDPDYPLERLAYMLEDARARVVLSRQGLAAKLPVRDARVVYIDAERERIAEEGVENTAGGACADNLAYVIYTSGSTGEPKGALLPHRGVVNCLHWMQETYHLDSSDRFLLKTSLNFDPSVYELFWPLMAGSAVVVARPGGHLDSAYLVETMVREQVTSAYFVPSMLKAMLGQEGVERAQSLRLVICGGESLPVEMVEQFYARLRGELHHSYGPSETSVSVTKWPCRLGHEWSDVPIGRPMGNVQLFILEDQLQPALPGAVGELHVGGAGLGRGYLNRPGLTAEKFVPHPFSQEPGARLYRTGDLVRYLNDGNIKFLGRLDQQVKVRGNRVEPGEIEAALVQHDAVRACVVIVREDAPADKRLVAYTTTTTAQPPAAPAALRRHLSERLPGYMIPQSFVALEELPLMPNGKIDRRALPAPELSLTALDQSFVGPRTPMEEIVINVWQEVLGVERVGVHDNFFDLGGHSLLATQVVSRLRHAYGVEVELRRLFERPTVAGLSDAVSEAGRGAQGIAAPPPIGRISRGQLLPLSFAQQRLWFLDQLQPDSAAYNIPSATRLAGRLNVAALEQSLREIIKRHEVLRTNFASVDGEPALVIAEETAFGLSTIDFSGLTDAERERDVRLLCRDEARRPFGLSAEPLLRATLVKVAEAEHVLLLVTHHIVTDGWSQGIMTRELAVLYDAFCDDRPSPLQDLPAQYADYASWQRRWLRGEALDKQLSYWRGQLAGVPPALQLPTDRPRPSAPNSKGASSSAWLDEGLTQSLNSLGRRQGVTTFMLLLAAFQALLYRYTGQDDIVVGTPIAGRTREELEPLIGLFVNTLVLRTDLSADPSFHQLLARVKEVCLGAYAHQDVPFEKLVEELQPERDLGRTPLFQVMFVLQNMPQEALKLPGLSLAPVPVENDTTKFDLTLSTVEAGGRLFCSLNYKTALFDAPIIERMLGHFRTLLEGVVAGPDQPLSTLPIFTAAERERLLFDRNRTERVYQAEASLHRLFEAQVERTPGAIALIFEGQTLSYGELNRRANQLAHHLRRHGVGPEIPVGIFMERSVEMAIAVMAVLKAGGAYLPLDTSNPRERLSLILDDAAVPLLLTQRRWVASLPGTRASVMCIGDDADALPAESEENPRAHADAQNPAYIIYTSGSTGRPKGVVIPHAGICNHMFWMAERFPLTAADRVLQKTPFSFDASVWEFFAPWLAGATLVMAQPGGHQDGSYLVRVVIEQQIGVLQVVPALLRMLVETDGLEQCRSLRRLFSGGEALPSDLVERLRERLPQVEIYNLYGPTEAAIDTSYWHCESPSGEEFEPIGRPLPNARLYVADAHLQPVPEGVGGELLIGGAGLARGYLHDPARTAEKFIPDPFGREAGARLYRSGDVVRYLPGGQLRFLGRNDHQVKIRGFRIEPGEIEAALRCHPAVREAVVVARADGEGDKRLVAYVAVGGQTGSVPTGGELQDFLHERLPSYMIPSAVVLLDALPLSSHGKVNVEALPTPDLTLTERGGNFLAPRDMTELRLMRVWEDILGVPTLGVTDNFFRLGGHSLLAVRMIAQARKRFGYRIPLAALFEEATVMHLAKVAREQAVSTREPSLIPIRPVGDSPPIFFVHPVGGRVFCYTALARHLDPGQPFYGFQSQVAEDGRPALTGIEAMAAHYLGELRGVQPSGPYFLGGWSMGGVIAFEMARQLEAQGQEVRLLALVDSVIPGFAAPPAGEVAGAAGATPGGDFAWEEESLLLNSFAQDLGLPPEQLAMTPAHLSSVEPGQQLTRVLEQARRIGVVPADIDLSVIERLYELFMSNHRALRSYAPKPYAGTALLIKAEGRANNYDLGPASGWDKLIGDLEIRRIPGTHYTIVREPYVKALAELLREHCRELERQTAGVGHAR